MNPKPSHDTEVDNAANQGEGNRDAARHYNESQKRFVDDGKVPQAAQRAEPNSPEEQRQMQAAEQEGRSHTKGEDPTVPGANAGSPKSSNKAPNEASGGKQR